MKNHDKTENPAELDEINFHELDKYQLDKEWERQPKLVRHFGEKLANAIYQHSLKKTEVKAAKARLALAIRQEPDRFGFPKVTENLIEQIIDADPEIANYEKALAKAQYAIDMYKTACETLEHRKKALENIVNLDGRDYFSRPKVPEAFREQANDRSAKAAINAGTSSRKR